MEAIRKQARQLREQVAKQQQSVLRQFSGRFGTESSGVEDADMECHQKLQRLYSSTRAAKHFQRNVVRCIENSITINVKQMEVANKLAEDCSKFGNQIPDSFLAKASVHFGNSHRLIEKERENLLRVLGDQVFETLRTMIMGAPLEDARHLTYLYERMRQDVESQAIEVVRRQLKSRDANANAETMVKLEHAETRLSELRSAMKALGREATDAMTSVETKQQQVTFQELLKMVEAERSYHENAASVLNNLYTEMVQEKRRAEIPSLLSGTNITNTSQTSLKTDVELYTTRTEKADDAQTALRPAELHTTRSDKADDAKNAVRRAELHTTRTDDNNAVQTVTKPVESLPMGEATTNGQNDFFIAEVVHPFDAQADGELSLSTGDYVVVRKVLDSGWSEGECKGNAGWFPSAYVAERDGAPASRLLGASSPEFSEKSPYRNIIL